MLHCTMQLSGPRGSTLWWDAAGVHTSRTWQSA